MFQRMTMTWCQLHLAPLRIPCDVSVATSPEKACNRQWYGSSLGKRGPYIHSQMQGCTLYCGGQSAHHCCTSQQRSGLGPRMRWDCSLRNCDPHYSHGDNFVRVMLTDLTGSNNKCQAGRQPACKQDVLKAVAGSDNHGLPAKGLCHRSAQHLARCLWTCRCFLAPASPCISIHAASLSYVLDLRRSCTAAKW